MFRRIEKRINSDLKPVIITSHGVSSFRGNNNQFFPRLQNTFEAFFSSRTLPCYRPLRHPMLSYRSGKSAVICKDGFYGPSEREVSEVKQHTRSCPLTYITFLKSKASLPGIDFSKKYTLEYLVTLKRRVLISNWYVNYIR